ncbi:anti-sigma factor family protein [Gordonia soli]|nr:hypothetical protein [Gordonia soli]
MTPAADRGSPSGDGTLPQPPFPVDLLADFHAGALPDAQAEHIRTHLDDDPAAREVLDALDRTRADLSGSPPPQVPLPESVQARTAATLAGISAEVAGGRGPATGDRPTDSSPPPPVDELAARRRRRWMAPVLSAAAAIVVAALVLSVGGSQGWFGRDSSADLDARSSTAVQPLRSISPAEGASLMSVLGRTDPTPFGSDARLRACLDANRVAPETAVVGSGPITLRGREGVVILLTTGQAGRFTALVVEPTCDVGNPATITTAVIGG